MKFKRKMEKRVRTVYKAKGCQRGPGKLHREFTDTNVGGNILRNTSK
jgi:hypothetical protein